MKDEKHDTDSWDAPRVWSDLLIWIIWIHLIEHVSHCDYIRSSIITTILEPSVIPPCWIHHWIIWWVIPINFAILTFLCLWREWSMGVAVASKSLLGTWFEVELWTSRCCIKHTGGFRKAAFAAVHVLAMERRSISLRNLNCSFWYNERRAGVEENVTAGCKWPEDMNAVVWTSESNMYLAAICSPCQLGLCCVVNYRAVAAVYCKGKALF